MRRSGRTTRIVDKAIQKFFEYGAIKIIPQELPIELKQVRGQDNNVYILDHHPGTYAARALFHQIVMRLKLEHPHLQIEISVNQQTIKLKS